MVERRLAELGRKAGAGAAVIAYPQLNSLLIKGSEQQLKLIKTLVTELDNPAPAVELSRHRHEVGGFKVGLADVASTPLSADQYERVRRAFARVAEQ